MVVGTAYKATGRKGGALHHSHHHRLEGLVVQHQPSLSWMQKLQASALPRHHGHSFSASLLPTGH
jgi:hypothetical protein